MRDHKQRKDGRFEEKEIHDSQVKTLAVRGVASLFLRQGVVRVLGFISMLVLARILTPEVFGIFAIAKFIVLFFEEVSGLGLATALIRKQEAVKDIELKTVFTLQQLMVLLFVIAIIMFAPQIAQFYDLTEDHEFLIQVLGVALFLASLKTVPNILLQRQLRFDKLALSEVAEHLVYIAFAIGLALYGLEIWALIIALMLRGVVGVVLIYCMAWWRPAFGFDRTAATETLKFGVPILLASMAALANNAVVPLVVGGMLGVASVGYINFAKTIMDAVAQQPLILVGKVQLRVFGRVQSDRDKLVKMVDRSIYIGSAISLLMLALLLSQAGLFIVNIVTDKWMPSLELIYVMAAGYVLYAFMYPFLQVLKATGDAMSPLMAYLLKFAVHITVFMLLLGSYGLVAYAWALIAAIAITFMYITFKSRQLFRFTMVVGTLPLMFSAACSGASAYHVGVSIGGIMGIVSGGMFCLIMYLIVIGCLNGSRFGKEFSAMLLAMAPTSQSIGRIASNTELVFARLDLGLLSGASKV